MNIIFNKKMLEHNPSDCGEGSYRLRDFFDWSEDIDHDGQKYLPLIYQDKYIKKVKKACENKNVLAEINLSPASFKAASLAVGLAVLAAEQNNFALIRPPGHHAGFEHAAGFCLFNNMAIATQNLIKNDRKVCIIDIDGHHGNGTQEIFYKSDKVLYCSIHQQPAYPGTGFIEEIGDGIGRGYNLNLPVLPDSGDDVFLVAINGLTSFIQKFNPDIIGVSAGFDGYYKDKLLELNYTLNSYFELGKILRQNFRNTFAVLEGGYHQDIKKCVDVFMAGINGQNIKIEQEKATSSAQCLESINRNVEALNNLLV